MSRNLSKLTAPTRPRKYRVLLVASTTLVLQACGGMPQISSSRSTTAIAVRALTVNAHPSSAAAFSVAPETVTAAMVLNRPPRPGRETSFTTIATGQMSAARANHTATLLSDGTVLIAGGFIPYDPETGCYDSLATTEIFDPHAAAF